MRSAAEAYWRLLSSSLLVNVGLLADTNVLCDKPSSGHMWEWDRAFSQCILKWMCPVLCVVVHILHFCFQKKGRATLDLFFFIQIKCVRFIARHYFVFFSTFRLDLNNKMNMNNMFLNKEKNRPKSLFQYTIFKKNMKKTKYNRLHTLLFHRGTIFF